MRIRTYEKRNSENQPLRRISSPRTKLLAARCECLHLIKINCLALWLDESAHACTRSELRGASCEDWKSALRRESSDAKLVCPRIHIRRVPRLRRVSRLKADFQSSQLAARTRRRSASVLPLAGNSSKFWTIFYSLREIAIINQS